MQRLGLIMIGENLDWMCGLGGGDLSLSIGGECVLSKYSDYVIK